MGAHRAISPTCSVERPRDAVLRQPKYFLLTIRLGSARNVQERALCGNEDAGVVEPLACVSNSSIGKVLLAVVRSCVSNTHLRRSFCG